MDMSFHIERKGVVKLVLLGAFTTALWLRAYQFHQHNREEKHLLDRWTAAQVITLSEPICRRFAPESRRLRLSAEIDRSSNYSWEVSCKDQSGHDVVMLRWDPHTGDLTEVSVWPDHSGTGDGAPISEREALSKMRYWLGVLRPDVSSGWHPVEAAHSDNSRNWLRHWTSRWEKAYIEIDAHSGKLRLAWFWRTRTQPDVNEEMLLKGSRATPHSPGAEASNHSL